MLDRLSKLVTKWARPGGDEAHRLYQSITESARSPEFYQRFGIPDTIDGRFDTLALMSSLVFRRIKSMGEQGEKLGQEFVDIMFADLDLSLHEIGVSENKVGKKVKTLAAGFIGRRKAYSDALDNKDDEGLSGALKRNLYRLDGTDPAKNGLLKAVKAQAKALDALNDDDLLTGSLPPLAKLIGK